MRIDAATGLTAEATAAEQRLSGLGVSPGIAIGPAYVSEGGDLSVHESHIADAGIEAERDRFAEAVAVSLKQLRKLKTKAAGLPESAAEEIGYLLDAHVAMLSNSRLVRGVGERIDRARINAERAVEIEIDEIAKSFAAMGDPYLAARIEDIRVVGTRLIRNLTKKPYVPFSGVTAGAVILADELTPADTALMDPQRVAGFATQFGGAESHTAIMARALGLPAVLARPRADRACAGRRDGGDRRRRGHRDHRPVGADHRRLRGAARPVGARAASSGAAAPAAGGDPRRDRDHPRSQSRIAASSWPRRRPTGRWGSGWCAPSFST